MSVPIGYTKVGTIAYTDKGDWDPYATYNKYNVVAYENSSYVCQQDEVIGIPPTSSTTIWHMVARGFSITYDDVPTAGSSNVVKSGGIYSSLQSLDNKKQDKFANADVLSQITGITDEVTAGSDSLVTSGGVKRAVDNSVTSFNGRSGSVLPIAGDYTANNIPLASALHIAGETQDDVEEALRAIVNNPAGHNVINSSALPMAGRSNLQFGSEYDPIFTEDDPTNNKTIVHGQLFICDSESDWNTLSDADFKAKYGADREQVGVYWYLPWANNIAYATDLNPVGTVLSCAVDTTNTTIFPADLIEFPNKDYVICRGATVKITDYPLLYQYFEDEYGDGNYFGTAQTAEGYFVLPNWLADFPTNGVLVIKARVTSDVITFAEVDDEAVTTENVWSAEKTKEEIDATQEDTGWIVLNSTYPTWYRKKNGYVTIHMRFSNTTPPTAGQTVDIGVLPEGYGPFQDVVSHTAALDGRLSVYSESHPTVARTVQLTPSVISEKVYGSFMICTITYPSTD